MKKLKKNIGIISVFVLLFNGVVCFDIPMEFLSGSIITQVNASNEEAEIEEKVFLPATPKSARGVKTSTNRNGYRVFHGYKTTEANASNEKVETEGGEVEGGGEEVVEEVVEVEAVEEKVFIPAMPKLTEGVKTYTNRNGYEVFHGYRYSDMPGNEQLNLVQQQRVERNAKRRYTGGASNFRTTNYRKETYASDMKPSAGSVANPEPSRKSLEGRKVIGYTRDIQPQKTRIQRYSLRQSLRERGVAESFKIAKDKKKEQNEMYSVLWKQNRVQRDDPLLRKDRSRITVKQSDSRKEYLKYWEEKKEKEEEFQKNLQIELYGVPLEENEEIEEVEEVEEW